MGAALAASGEQAVIAQIKRAYGLARATTPLLRGSVVPAGAGAKVTVEVQAGEGWRWSGSVRLGKNGGFLARLARPGVYRIVYDGLPGPAVVVP